MAAVREAVVGGLCCPATPGALRTQIVDGLSGVDAADDATRVPPELLINRHAGPGATSGTSRGAVSPSLIPRRNGQGDPPWS